MNQRNVEALRLLLRDESVPHEVAAELALALASRGVLVPSALTDAECDHCWGDVMLFLFRDCLERVAKGEPHP